MSLQNVWASGEPIENRSVMARYIIRRVAKGVTRVTPRRRMLATGPLRAERTTYEDMIVRVRTIADKAAELIDAQA